MLLWAPLMVPQPRCQTFLVMPSFFISLMTDTARTDERGEQEARREEFDITQQTRTTYPHLSRHPQKQVSTEQWRDFKMAFVR